MVARIRTGKNIKGAISYNEHKVKNEDAELIAAKGYPKDPDQLGYSEKWKRLQKLADKNQRTQTNCVHISLNFHPGEKLSKEQLEKIAAAYMEKIGFGDQPYLLYVHYDAGHPHIHVVTTNIKKDGTRISTHNLGKTLSEKARKEIEEEFGLVKAQQQKKQFDEPLKPVDIKKASYGKEETKKAISNIVNAVVQEYKFSSLEQLNAVLNQYGVSADPGQEGSLMREKGGLQFSMLDEEGNKIGIPIKSSSIYGKPTLANLEKKFARNKTLKEPYKEPLKEKLDAVLKENNTPESFKEKLKQLGITVIYRTNEEGFIYGVTYVDHNTKTVFNGSDLGKEHSAAAMREYFSQKEKGESTAAETQTTEFRPQEKQDTALNIPGLNTSDFAQPAAGSNAGKEILEILVDPKQTSDYLPWQLKKKRKKKTKGLKR